MNYKDIDFTIENAEKYKDAMLIRHDYITNEWHMTKDNSKVFFASGIMWDYCDYEYALKHYKLRIPVEYSKMKLFLYSLSGSWYHSGYSIHIDENGNPIGEPFKTAP